MDNSNENISVQPADKTSPGILDFILLGSAFAFCCILIVMRVFKLAADYTFSGDVVVFTGSLWIALLAFQFKALRKTFVFTGWLVISIIMLFMYLWLQNDSMAIVANSNGSTYNCATLLTIPFIMLVYFQLCRQISLQVNKTELLIPRRYSTYDVIEKRSYNGMDILCAIGLWVIPAVIAILAKK